MAFTRASLVKDILANPAARAVVERHLPGATNHPQIYEAMYMTLGEVATYPESGLNQQKLQLILADLAQIEG
ncbi:MAG: hypothetical protein DCC57_03610 [Chloroflexi bacterium]|nr:MAG: hypothetical protein DCC57_03610 [Chloroflexota bacterium]